MVVAPPPATVATGMYRPDHVAWLAQNQYWHGAFSRRLLEERKIPRTGSAAPPSPTAPADERGRAN